MNPKPLLVLGIGNKILTDDGIGVRLAEDLEHRFQNPLIRFKTSCAGGLEVVEIMEGYDDVIILDAIKTAEGKPGSIYGYTVDDFKETLHISSFHDISFLIALEFGKKSGMRIPGNIQILAVEIVEDLAFNENFSEDIASRYLEIKNKIYEFLQKQLELKFVTSSETLHI